MTNSAEMASHHADLGHHGRRVRTHGRDPWNSGQWLQEPLLAWFQVVKHLLSDGKPCVHHLEAGLSDVEAGDVLQDSVGDIQGCGGGGVDDTFGDLRGGGDDTVGGLSGGGDELLGGGGEGGDLGGQLVQAGNRHGVQLLHGMGHGHLHSFRQLSSNIHGGGNDSVLYDVLHVSVGWELGDLLVQFGDMMQMLGGDRDGVVDDRQDQRLLDNLQTYFSWSSVDFYGSVRNGVELYGRHFHKWVVGRELLL